MADKGLGENEKGESVSLKGLEMRAGRLASVNLNEIENPRSVFSRDDNRIPSPCIFFSFFVLAF